MFLNTYPGLVMQHHQHFVADQSAYTAAHRLSPITLRFPAVMTTTELAAWAQVGKNAVPQLAARFGIRELMPR